MGAEFMGNSKEREPSIKELVVFLISNLNEVEMKDVLNRKSI